MKSPVSKLVSLYIATNLTDVEIFLDAFGVMASSDETIHCAVTDYLCATNDPSRWENKICHIPAFSEFFC